VKIAGVIANRCGSPRHIPILKEALAAAGLPPLLGAIPRDTLPRIPDRHLGLVTPGQAGFPEGMFTDLADAISQHVDLDAIVAVAESAEPVAGGVQVHRENSTTPSFTRIGIAIDRAFSFYYPDNLRLLEQIGAVLVPFSPLADAGLPPDLDALYIGGGYPEEYAEQLSGNGPMLQSVCAFADSGAAVYAECGGLMYLSESLTARGGDSFAMAGILPCSTVMLPRLRTLGYAEVALSHDSILGPGGTVLRGHEYHYSDLQTSSRMNDGWQTAYVVRHRSGQESEQGLLKGNILASYVHLHFGSNPGAVSFLTKHTRQES